MQFKGDTKSRLTPDWVLQRVTQEQIMQRYLGVTIQTKHKFCSPLRPDRSPTCGFKYYGGRLRFRDWAKVGSHTTQDCFDVVQETFSCDFQTALQIIARDFDLKKVDPIYKPYRTASVLARRQNLDRRRTQIGVKRRSWTQQDADYLKSFGISRAICEQYNVFPLATLWIDDKIIWNHKISDPALGYYFGTDDEKNQHWKIYFWKRQRKNKTPRFYSNTSRLQGYNQLPDKGEIVVVTKSLKDVMTLARLGVDSFAPQSESIILDNALLDELRERFNRVVALYDRDKAGKQALIKLKELGCIPLMIPNQYGSKDVSDLVQEHGLAVAEELAREVRQWLLV